MSTLDDLLALLPDNTEGDISAEDLRQVVTGLWQQATLVREAFSYQWALGDPTPGGGHFSLDQGWDVASTTLYINKTTQDGETLPPGGTINQPGRFVLIGPGAARAEGVITVAPTDSGAFFTIPVEMVSAIGTPADNAEVRFVFVWSAE